VKTEMLSIETSFPDPLCTASELKELKENYSEAGLHVNAFLRKLS